MKPPKTDFAQIKAITDIVKVIESYGIVLKAQGKDYVGLCPFHDDHDPSFRVTPRTRLFRCMSCGATGNVIQFVAKKEGITDKEAGLKLNSRIPGVQRGSELKPVAPEPQATTEPTPPAPKPPYHPSPQEAAALMKRVATFYAKALFKDQAGLNYLKTRRLDQAALLETFSVGYCDGTMKKALPKSGEVIEGLKALGILNDNGNECFYGRVVVPILDEAGNVVSFYGRRLTEEKSKHLYQAGTLKGVFNAGCLKAHKTVLITEAIFDAMSLWSAGFHNVISLYGNQGWIAEHETLLKENGITTIYLCLDNDERSREATEKLKAKLELLSLAVHVVQWPEGVKDANEFFLSRSPADFETLLQAATPKQETAPVSQETERLGKESIEARPNGFMATYGPRRYELCAIEKPSPGRLKATAKAIDKLGKFFIDTVDFYLSRSRQKFITEAARLLKESIETIEADVNRIIVQLESHASQPAQAEEKKPLMTAEEQAEAMRMLRSPGLIDEIQRDLGKLGLIGEEQNRLLLYLGVTSRKMDDPLAIQILSSSGAGKSHLQDAVLSLCPPEDLIKLTSLSGQALFYKGEDSLKHKCLAISEVSGAEGARYALRNLISDKKLINEATIKNPITGRMETQINIVYGPTAVFETTTQPNTDAETKSRYHISSVDESARQTTAILEAQRNSHTLEGRKRKQVRLKITAKHHAAQRLLQPLVVINPYEPLLTYGENQDGRLAFRRDHPKYLHLILTVTFLHQMQRPRKHDPEIGDYIETTLEDISITNELAHRLFGQSLDDLSVPSREAFESIIGYVEKKAQELSIDKDRVEFCRRELRDVFGWSDTRLRVYLGELVDMEYLAPVSGRNGLRYCYRLIDEGMSGEKRVAGLKDVETLRKEAELTGLAVDQRDAGPIGHDAGPNHPAAQDVDPTAGNGHPAATLPLINGEVEKPDYPRENGHEIIHPAVNPGERIYVLKNHRNGGNRNGHLNGVAV